MWPFIASRFDRVVSVEHRESADQFILFRRTGDTVEELSISSKHYFIVDSPELITPHAGCEVIMLEGNLPLRFLVLCQTLSDYRQALRHAQSRGRALYGEGMSDHIWHRGTVEAFLMRSGTALFTEMNPEDITVAALDFEMYTSNGKHFPDASCPSDKIIIATLADNRGNTFVFNERALGEAGLIEAVCELICRNDYDVLCGHNLVGFDLPYLTTRAKQLNIKLTLGRDASVLEQRISRRRYALREAPEFHIFGRHIIDTLPLLMSWDMTNRALDNWQLKDAVVALGLSKEDRRDFDRSNISALWDDNASELLAYAQADASDSLSLYRFLSPSLFYQTQLLPLTYQQCATTGTGTKVDISLIRAYLRKTHSLPLRGALIDGEGRGGLTEARRLGWHSSVHKADVASLYPSICLTYGIKPRTDILSAFPAVLRVLTERRLQAKARLKELEPDSYEQKATDAMQNSLKILINSFYGMLGTSGLYFSDSEASNEITTKGQEILLNMVENVERVRGKVIEIDTDGLYFTLPGDFAPREIAALVAKGLASGIRVDYDGYYDYMYSYAPKNYILLQGEKLIRKGVVFRSRKLYGLQEDFIMHSVECLRKDTIGMLAEYYRRTAKRIRLSEVVIKEISTYLSVDQTFEEYKANLKTDGQRSRPMDLVVNRPDRERWSLRSKIHYYHAGQGEIKLVEDFAGDPDREFYLELLKKTAEKFLYAFRPEDWHRVFSETLVPESFDMITPWGFSPVEQPEVLREYANVIKGDFQLRLF